MIHFTLESHKYKLPTNWTEITIATYQRMVTVQDGDLSPLRILAALSGADYQALADSKADLAMHTREALTFWAAEVPNFLKLPLRDKYSFRGKFYDRPKNIELERMGQKIMLQQKMQEAKDVNQCLAFAIALYMQPILDDDKFDEKRIPELEQEVLAMKVLDLYPLALFFSQNLIGLSLSGTLGL